METYQPTVLRPRKKVKREVMYAIGEDDEQGGYGMWAGPVPDEGRMLETIGKSNKSCLIRFNEDDTDEVIWKWNNDDEVWEKFDEKGG